MVETEMLKFRCSVFGTSIGYGILMEQTTTYTIHFIYEIREDALKFQLQADVTVMADNTYHVGNIRHAGKTGGSLIPPFSLIKHKGSWIYLDSKKETVLSLAIGHGIDNYGKNLLDAR